MTEHATFGRTIRSRRRAKDLTLGYVARALGVSPSYVSMVERGKKPPFPESKLVILAQLLGIELGALRNLAVVARGRIELETQGASPARQELAVALARGWGDLTNEQVTAIHNILKEDPR